MGRACSPSSQGFAMKPFRSLLMHAESAPCLPGVSHALRLPPSVRLPHEPTPHVKETFRYLPCHHATNGHTISRLLFFRARGGLSPPWLPCCALPHRTSSKSLSNPHNSIRRVISGALLRTRRPNAPQSEPNVPSLLAELAMDPALIALYFTLPVVVVKTQATPASPAPSDLAYLDSTLAHAATGSSRPEICTPPNEDVSPQLGPSSPPLVTMPPPALPSAEHSSVPSSCAEPSLDAINALLLLADAPLSSPGTRQRKQCQKGAEASLTPSRRASKRPRGQRDEQDGGGQGEGREEQFAIVSLAAAAVIIKEEGCEGEGKGRGSYKCRRCGQVMRGPLRSHSEHMIPLST